MRHPHRTNESGAAVGAPDERRAPAHVRRLELKASVARELSRLLYDCEVEQLDLAAATGASSSVVQRWCDRSRLETISLADVVLIGKSYPRVGLGLLRWAGEELGFVVAERVGASGPAAWFRLLGDALDAAHGVQRAILSGIAEHGEAGADLTTGELEDIEKKLVTLEAVAVQIRETFESERAKRVGGNGAGAPATRGDGDRTH